jgi:hypothetical protein
MIREKQQVANIRLVGYKKNMLPKNKSYLKDATMKAGTHKMAWVITCNFQARLFLGIRWQFGGTIHSMYNKFNPTGGSNRMKRIGYT